MKILFANEYIYPNVVSGAEFSMQELALALKQKGEEIVFFGPDLSKKKVVNYQGIKITKFPFVKKIKNYSSLSPIWFNNPVFWFYSAFFILLCCFKEKINLIHVHGKYLLPGSVLAGKLLGLPIAATVRDYKFLCPLGLCLTEKEKACDWSYYLNKEISFYLDKYHHTSKKQTGFYLKLIAAKGFQQINLLFLKRSNQVICVSKALKSIYLKSGIKKSQLITIYNLPPVVKNKASLKLNIVLSAGKLSYGKGTDLLIKTAGLVKKKLSGVRFILIGSKSDSLNTDTSNVEYLGQLNHQLVFDYFRKTSVFVLLSRWPEPLSRASLEALSFGLPLVVSKKGGNTEVVIDGKNGYWVELDPQKVAAKILLLLKDKRKRLAMGKKSLDLLETRFNREKIINQHLDIYRKLIK